MTAGHALPEFHPLGSFFQAFFACIWRSGRRKIVFGKVFEMFAWPIHIFANSWVIIEIERIFLFMQSGHLVRMVWPSPLLRQHLQTRVIVVARAGNDLVNFSIQSRQNHLP